MKVLTWRRMESIWDSAERRRRVGVMANYVIGGRN